MRRRDILFAGLIILAAACHKQEVRAPEPAPAPAAAPTEREALAALEAADRPELVTPPPDFWKPQSADAALKLTLSLEKTTLRAGEKIRYRLEVQNVGARDYYYYESPSFIKIGSEALDENYKFRLTSPDGSEAAVYGPMLDFSIRPQALGLPPGYAQMPPAERAAIGRKRDDAERERSTLFLTLHPGETLSTRPDSPGTAFRGIISETTYDEPGRYRLRLIYDTGIAADGGTHAESNTIPFEVVP